MVLVRTRTAVPGFRYAPATRGYDADTDPTDRDGGGRGFLAREARGGGGGGAWMPAEPDRGMEVMDEGFSQIGRARGRRTFSRAPSRGGAAEGFLAGGRLGASGMGLRRWMPRFPAEGPRGGGTMAGSGEEAWIEQRIVIAGGRGGSARGAEESEGVCARVREI
jgi:hypothetical protein